MDKRHYGLATGIPSGNCIVIQGREEGDEVPPTKEIYFAFIETPKMANPQREGEPYAFAAREYVRKTLIGKRIGFKIEYRHDNKDYVSVWLENAEDKTEIDIVAELLQQGLAKMKGNEDKNEERWDELKDIQDSAKVKGVGIWSDEEEETKTHEKIIFPGTTGYNMEKVFKEVQKEKGETKGIVEYQFMTNAYNVLLVKYKTVVKIASDYIFNLPGGPKATEKQQKLSKKAKAFAERAVQHQDVTVIMEKYDSSNSVILGRILMPNGHDLATELIVNGYGKLKMQTADMDAKYYASLRVALNQAQLGHKGFWKDSESKTGGEKNKYSAYVIEVNSGDSITVIKEGGSEEIRLFLAGVKAPKLASNKGDFKGEPFSWEAKEHLRRLIIGKKVEVNVEHTRIPKQEEGSAVPKKPMTFVDILTADGKCINVEMTALGLVMALNPRLDEALGEYYQEIADAAAKAKKEKKGINHVGKTPPLHTYQSLIGHPNQKTLAYYQDLFRKTPNVNGVVEYCFSGSRYKIRIDSMDCYIPFICQGLQPIPQDANVPELQNLYFNGQKFARKNLLQRDVKLEIHTNDRKGNFFGTMISNGKNFAVELLEEGLVAINRSADRGISTKKDIYDEAEDKAKAAKKGIWNAKNSIVVDLLFGGAGKIEPLEGTAKIEVVKCMNNRYFHAALIDDSAAKKAESIVQSFNPAKADKLSMPIRPGTYCMALYTEDGKWYRGQVERSVSETSCEVFFIDYGNTENVNVTNIRKIDLKLIKECPPCAFKIGLAYLNIPKLESMINGKSLKSILGDQLEEREVTITYKYKENNVIYGIILEKGVPDIMKSFNAYLIQKGLARVSDTISLPDSLKEWEDMQTEAESTQKGFWATDEFNGDYDEEY